jgi:hypothetical protein
MAFSLLILGDTRRNNKTENRKIAEIAFFLQVDMVTTCDFSIEVLFFWYSYGIVECINRRFFNFHKFGEYFPLLNFSGSYGLILTKTGKCVTKLH